jgi:hypothetical protein
MPADSTSARDETATAHRVSRSSDGRLRQPTKTFLAATTAGLGLAAGCGAEGPPESPADVPVVMVQEATPAPLVAVDGVGEGEAEPEYAAKPAHPEPAVGMGTPCDAATQVALRSAVAAREKRELSAGMKPEGAFGCGMLAPGQTVTVPLTLAPGRCYAFIGHGFPKVTEVDLVLRPNMGPSPPMLAPFAAAALAQDNSQGPLSSIGTGPANACYKNPLPIPVPVLAEAKAVAGSGPVAIQAYGL